MVLGGSERVGVHESWIQYTKVAWLVRRFRTGFECCSCSQCWCRLLDLGKQCSDPSLSCQMESCCLVAFQVCPAGFNLKATLGINVVSWFLIPYFSWPKVRPAASLYRHAHSGFTVLTSATANCELHLLPPKKRREMLLSLSQTRSGSSVSDPDDSSCLITSWNQARNQWLHLQRPHHFREWWWSSLWMYTGLRSGNSEATAVKLSSWNWRQLPLDLYPLQKEGIPVWPVSYRSMQD